MNNSAPIACDLTAIEDEEREQHQQAAEAVFTAVKGLREIPDGYAFRLPTETEIIERAGAFISRERLCCPFFNFTLEVKAGRGPVWINVTGRQGVKQYIEETVLPHWGFDETAG